MHSSLDMQKFMPDTPREKIVSKFCPYCTAKLTLRERFEKKRNEKIVCRNCGEDIMGDMIIIEGKKLKKKILIKR